jgi:hypothetical protein
MANYLPPQFTHIIDLNYYEYCWFALFTSSSYYVK